MDHTPKMDPIAALRTGIGVLLDGSVDRRASFGLTERLAALSALAATIRAMRDEIRTAVGADMGKSAEEVDLVEIMPTLAELTHARRHLRRWMAPRRAWPTDLMFGTSARIVPQPKGVALVIAPWNFPLMLALVPVISAVAAGNAVVLKPSELTPATSAILQRLLARALPQLCVVAEGGADVAQALLSLPFDHVFFTGSPSVGRLVMEAASLNLTPVTLELGGKSPAIIGPDADLNAAARWLAWGKCMNAGQTCVAPDHVFVPRAQESALANAIRAEVAKMYGTDAGASRDLTHIVNDRHFARLDRLLSDAAAKGAQIESLGSDDPKSRVLAPRLLRRTTREMAISSEEIFGPVLPLIPYEDPGEVIAQINGAPKPLTLYVFARDGGFVRRVTTETQSGSVGVNLTIMPFIHANMPFGGIGNSGIGSGHGRSGFETFSHLKPVMRNRFTLLPLLFPPYGARVRRLVSLLLAYLR